MANKGKCPNCEKTISKIIAEDIEIASIKGHRLNFGGISYHCSSCHAILSVAINPMDLIENTETITKVRKPK